MTINTDQMQQATLPEGLTGSYLIISQVQNQQDVLNQVEKILRQRAREHRTSLDFTTTRIRKDILVTWRPIKEAENSTELDIPSGP